MSQSNIASVIASANKERRRDRQHVRSFASGLLNQTFIMMMARHLISYCQHATFVTRSVMMLTLSEQYTRF